jgi:hypothetical protein
MDETKTWWIDGNAEWTVDTGNSWLLVRMYKDVSPYYPSGEVMAMFRQDLSAYFSEGDVVDISARIRYDRGDRGFARTSVAFAWGDTRAIDPGGRGADENTGSPWFCLANNTDAPDTWHVVTLKNVAWGNGDFCMGFGMWANLTDQASPPITPDFRMEVDYIHVEHSPMP